MNGRSQIDPRGGGSNTWPLRVAARIREVCRAITPPKSPHLQMLAHTRAELDEAVAAAPEISGSDPLASPEIRALLVRAVKARNHLDSVLSSPRRFA